MDLATEGDAVLLEQAGCGTSGTTSGPLGSVDGKPAGWVVIEPRENYPRIWARVIACALGPHPTEMVAR